MANDPAQIGSDKPATHLSTSELSELLLASIRDTLPSASVMEIEDFKVPGELTRPNMIAELTIVEENLLTPPDTPIPTFENDPFNPLCERLKSR